MSAALVSMTTLELPTLYNGYYARVAPKVALGNSPRQQSVTEHNVSPTGRLKGLKGSPFHPGAGCPCIAEQLPAGDVRSVAGESIDGLLPAMQYCMKTAGFHRWRLLPIFSHLRCNPDTSPGRSRVRVCAHYARAW